MLYSLPSSPASPPAPPPSLRPTNPIIDRSMNAPGFSARDIQNHLYMAFLESKTADVALRVKGSWSAIYKLHRVVLIQSEFFRSLFTAGFAESSTRFSSHQHGPDEIDIIFDDHNITRAAFEVCISRLYGGGPPLHVSPSIIPSPSQPLTPSFPFPQELPSTPPGHHPATPRFLLSLLATAIYLSIPTVATQALSLILNTIGPHTVLLYHNFALGKSIGPPPTLFPEPEAAVGLEHVAYLVDDESDWHSMYSGKGKKPELALDDVSAPMAGLELKENSLEPPSPDGQGSSSSSVSDEDTHSIREIKVDYGAIGDKIGEATSSWLARWAVDMLAYEEGVAPNHESTPAIRRRSYTFSAGTTPSNVVKGPIVPTIWGRGGLSAKWVAAIVASDTLFVRGERERYDFARSVVELRRKDGIVESEEQVWDRMFDEAIYYSNLSMEDIIAISQDISPTAHRPFVPLTSLQKANWDQSILRHSITFRPSPHSSPSNGSPTSPGSPPRDKELGVCLTTTEIISRLNRLNESERALEGKKTYYVVPGNSSIRIGHSANASGDGNTMSMDQLFAATRASSSLPLSSSHNSHQQSSVSESLKTRNHHHGSPWSANTEANYFGLQPAKFPASALATVDPTGEARWSPYPPFRFGVEFWDVDSLKDKDRLYSHTIWYAGSLFNVYMQVVKKKAQFPLGIYLHRQSSVDPIPPPSAPSLLMLRGERERGLSVSASAMTLKSPAANDRVSPGSSSMGLNGHRPSLPNISGVSSLSSTTSPPASTSLVRDLPRRSVTPNVRDNSRSRRSPGLLASPPSSASNTSLVRTASTTPPPQPAAGLSSPSSPYLPFANASLIDVSVGNGTVQVSRTIPATSTPIMPPHPYRDSRGVVTAYFGITCASATGTSQTRFSSAPDVFAISKSWGWKSSSLRTEEFMDVASSGSNGSSGDVRGEGGGDGESSVVGSPSIGGLSASTAAVVAGKIEKTEKLWPGREVSLRATVVIGLV
ncbi:hypothetical protein AX16_000568 [Volvariella volvacea WC 439]|nr:hypothetical protein AX16_000568 [Volvariella volvacea WC 439]